MTKLGALQIFQARDDDTDSRDLNYLKHFCGGKNLQTFAGERKSPLGGPIHGTGARWGMVRAGQQERRGTSF